MPQSSQKRVGTKPNTLQKDAQLNIHAQIDMRHHGVWRTLHILIAIRGPGTSIHKGVGSLFGEQNDSVHVSVQDVSGTPRDAPEV